MARDWQRLGALVQQRRSTLGFKTAKDFADRVGVSVETIGNIENARRPGYRIGIRTAVEDTLGWAQGSFMAVADGAKPKLRRDPLLDRVRQVWPQLDEQSKKMFVEVLEAVTRKQ